MGISVGGTTGLGMRVIGFAVMSPSDSSHEKNPERCLQAVKTVAGRQRSLSEARYTSTSRRVAVNGSYIFMKGRK
jgi:hypothetical protein